MPDLPPALLQRLQGLVQTSQLPRRGAWLSAGQRWQQMVWVQQGALRLYYLDRDGHESVKNFFLDGGWCWPITPTLAEQPVSFFIEALEPTPTRWRRPRSVARALPWHACPWWPSTWPAGI